MTQTNTNYYTGDSTSSYTIDHWSPPSSPSGSGTSPSASPPTTTHTGETFAGYRQNGETVYGRNRVGFLNGKFEFFYINFHFWPFLSFLCLKIAKNSQFSSQNASNDPRQRVRGAQWFFSSNSIYRKSNSIKIILKKLFFRKN